MKEIWKDIIGFEGLYQISNFGNVKSLERIINSRYYTKMVKKEKSITPAKNGEGYLSVTLYRDNKKISCNVHRMVAICFLPNHSNKLTVNHIDGNKLNNHISNLEWNTHSENSKHAFTIGLRNLKGESHNRSKLKNEDIFRIRSSEFNHLDDNQISNIFNVSKSLITKVKLRKIWTHI